MFISLSCPPQESVLFRYYRHERPIAIVRPVLKYPIKMMDNSQGKCARYKAKLRPIAHWSNDIIALSRVMNNPMRRRIAVTPNDNSNGKSSRFKGHAIVRVQTPSAQILEYAIACTPPFPSALINYLRNTITMTPPMSPGIQRPCFLPIDLRVHQFFRLRPAPSSVFRPSAFFRLRFNSRRFRPAMRFKCFRPAMRFKCFRPAM